MGRYGKRCFAVIYRARRWRVLSLLSQVRNPVRRELWAPLQGSNPASLSHHATAPLPIPCYLYPKPHSCSFKYSGDSGICIYSTPTASLLNESNLNEIYFTFSCSSTHSKKYLPVNNYFFRKQKQFEIKIQNHWKLWHFSYITSDF